jgi:hypothetical protein
MEIKLEDDRKIKSAVSGLVCESVQSVVAKESHRPDAGQLKTKQMAEQAAHREKKAEAIEQLVNIQQQRLNAFDTYVNNQAQLGTFHMCAMSSNTDLEKTEMHSRKVEEFTLDKQPEEGFNLEDFDMEEDHGKVPAHEKLPDMMTLLPLPPKAAKPPTMEMPLPARVAKPTRHHEPDDKNEEHGNDEMPTLCRGHNAVGTRAAATKQSRHKCTVV